jgi:serine/threonine-protein kinase
VPKQFDDLVACATARDPANRYLDARDMGAELAAIVTDLGLPEFRVPAPKNSAQHTAAAAAEHSPARAERTTTATGRAAEQPKPNHTLQFTMDPAQWHDSRKAESSYAAGQFAGINIEDFEWARQRSRRLTLFWVIAVLTMTGLVAAGAWALGSNVNGLL